jgi:tRNA(Arg) A34 adenosine deaminase TadA
MLRAFTEAEKAAERGEVPVGAVITDKLGNILAVAGNRNLVDHDPTAHAEVTAIRKAAAVLGTFDLSGCEIYTSCEPCPMCLAAAYWARIARIVYANRRDEAAAIGFDDAFIYDEIPLAPAARRVPALHRPSEEAKAVFAEWLKKADRIPY